VNTKARNIWIVLFFVACMVYFWPSDKVPHDCYEQAVAHDLSHIAIPECLDR